MTYDHDPSDPDPVKVACVVGGTAVLGPIGAVVGLGVYHLLKTINN